MDLASSPPSKRHCSKSPSVIPETQDDQSPVDCSRPKTEPFPHAEDELASLREENTKLRNLLIEIKKCVELL